MLQEIGDVILAIFLTIACCGVIWAVFSPYFSLNNLSRLSELTSLRYLRHLENISKDLDEMNRNTTRELDEMRRSSDERFETICNLLGYTVGDNDEVD